MANPFDEEYFTRGTTGYRGYTDFPVNLNKAEKILNYDPVNVLDVGCARGFIVKRLNDAGVTAYGIDISRYAVDNCAHNNVMHGDVLDLPYKDGYFDFVYSSDMLEHIPEADVAIAIDEIARVGKRGLLEITYEKTPMDIDDTHITMKPYSWWRERVPEQFDISHPDEYTLKLNIGCFTSFYRFMDTWINIDRLDLSPVMHRRCGFLQCDVTEGIPYPDNSVALIYHSDFFEHLSYPEAKAFLKECYRVLKPGGRMRVCVPDISIFIDHYEKDRMDVFEDIQPKEYTEVLAASTKLSMLLFGSVGSTQKQYQGHQMMYDAGGLLEMLSSAGFQHIEEMEIDISVSPFMCNKDVHRDMELIMECVK